MSGILLQASEKEFVVSVGTDKKREIRFNPQDFHSFQLGYASTYYRSQGRTVDRAYVLYSPGMNKKEFYVGITRHVRMVNFFVSKEEVKSLSHLKWSLSNETESRVTTEFTNLEKLKLDTARDSKLKSVEELKGSKNLFKKIGGHSLAIWDSLKQKVEGYYQYKQDVSKNHDFFSKKIETSSVQIRKFTFKENEIEAVEEKVHEKNLIFSDIQTNIIREYRSSLKDVALLREVLVAESERLKKDFKDLPRYKDLKKAWSCRDANASKLIKSFSYDELKSIFGNYGLKSLQEQAERFENYQKNWDTKKLNREEIEKKLLENVDNLLHRLYPEGPSRKERHSLRFGRKGALCVNVSGQNEGRFYDFENQEGGSLLKLIEKNLGVQKNEAENWAKDFLKVAQNLEIPKTFQPSKESHLIKENWVAVRPPYSKPPKEKYALKFEKEYKETVRHSYRDENGNLLFYVIRLVSGNDKITLPLSYGSYKNRPDQFYWTFKQYSATDRPLYNLQLLKDSDKPVLIVEGEKAADAASNQFPDFNVISWSGGSGAVSKTNWMPLKGKDILIWPDNDKMGFKAAGDITKELKKIGVAKLRVVDSKSLTESFPTKWDLADSLPENQTQQGIQNLMLSAKEVAVNPYSVLILFEAQSSSPVHLSKVNEVLWRVDERLREGLESQYGNMSWKINEQIIHETVNILKGEKELLSKVEKEFSVSESNKQSLAHLALMYTAKYGKQPSSSYLELVKERIRETTWLPDLDHKIKKMTENKEVQNFAYNRVIEDIVDRPCAQIEAEQRACSAIKEQESHDKVGNSIEKSKPLTMKNELSH